MLPSPLRAYRVVGAIETYPLTREIEHFHGKEGVVGSSPIPAFALGASALSSASMLALWERMASTAP
jgi:hypothetical protein